MNPNNIFSLCFSPWFFFLLNNNIRDCSQQASWHFLKGQRGLLHTERPPLCLPRKSVEATQFDPEARKSRKPHPVGKGRGQVIRRHGIIDHQAKTVSMSMTFPDRCRNCWPREVKLWSQNKPYPERSMGFSLSPQISSSEKGVVPGWVVQLVGASSCTPEGYRFHSWSGRIPRLRVQSLVEMCTGGNRLIFLSHINVSLSLSLSLSLSPLPPSLKSIKTYPWVRIFLKEKKRVFVSGCLLTGNVPS